MAVQSNARHVADAGFQGNIPAGKPTDFIQYIEDKEEASNSTEDVAEPNGFWENVGHSELLHKLTDETWSDFVHSHPRVLVTIYSPDCPNCQNIRKPLAEAAYMAENEKLPVVLAVIDSQQYEDRIYRMWTPDMGVPTLFWYERGVRRFEYTNSREANDLLEFLRKCTSTTTTLTNDATAGEGTPKLISVGIGSPGLASPKKPKTKEVFPDWSMEETAEDIYHLDDSGFESFAEDQEDMLVFFYSPSCSLCYQTRKMYENASKILDQKNPDVTLAAVNLAKGRKLKEKFGINSYPYFAYFRKGKFKYQYNGQPLVDDIVAFMKKPRFIPKPPTLEDWANTPSNVTILSKKNFRKFMKKHDQVVVMFYAKWCAHCKRFKSDFVRAADVLTAKGSTAKLAAVDGDQAKKLMSKYNVTGFPTLLYFKNGKFLQNYKGQRTGEALVKFLSRADDEDKNDADADGMCQIGECEPTLDDDEVSDGRPALVELLSPSNFPDVISRSEQMLVMFYSPGCGACKAAKEPFFQAALEASEELPGTKLALCNAAKHQRFAEEYSIKGYPTFWYFRDGKKMFQYYGERSKRAFVNFLANPKEEADPRPRDSTVQWISESSFVEHLNRDNFDRFVKKYDHVLAFFYINMCKLCLDVIKPEYVKAADRLFNKRLPGRLAAINGDWDKPLVKKYGVESYPTFLYFHKGGLKYKYQGGKKASDFVKFMKKPREELAKRVKPTSWQDMAAEEYGAVVHLGNKTYDEFIESHPFTLILFHSLHYERCKAAREIFRRAADLLAGDKRIGLGAVDCHREPEQGLVCYHKSIRRFPLYKYYHNGLFLLDLPVESTRDIISFIEMKAERSDKDEL